MNFHSPSLKFFKQELSFSLTRLWFITRKETGRTTEKCDCIKKNGAPFFIELETYRWREHCGPNFDNDIGYRSEDEFLQWKKRDPIKLFEKELIKEKIATKNQLSLFKKDIKLKVKDAFEYAEKSPFPNSSKAYESMFKVSWKEY